VFSSYKVIRLVLSLILGLASILLTVVENDSSGASFTKLSYVYDIIFGNFL
jgi:hypothetical protein